jgi:hypothetical protein
MSQPAQRSGSAPKLNRGCFSRADLLAFVASVWPLAQEDPDVGSWAREFIDAVHGSMTARATVSFQKGKRRRPSSRNRG